jgi:hypothetical protein
MMYFDPFPHLTYRAVDSPATNGAKVYGDRELGLAARRSPNPSWSTAGDAPQRGDSGDRALRRPRDFAQSPL